VHDASRALDISPKILRASRNKPPVGTRKTSTMGLTERRATKEFQDKQLPGLQAEIHKIVGFAVPLEIEWNQLAVEGESNHYAAAWPELYFKPVIEGLRQIARDDMGKEAVKAGLKKIELRNSKDTANANNAISFVSGALIIDHKLSNVGDVADRIKCVVKAVENGL
jgi:hypothetical protein